MEMSYSAVILTIFANVILLTQSAAVVRFSIGERMLAKQIWKRPRLALDSFQWKSCAAQPASQLLQLQSLTLTPDPVDVTGSVTAGFSVIFNKTLDSPPPPKMDVVLEKSVFGEWLKLPCVDQIGSCSYPDLCQLLSPLNCPLPFVQQSVPCKCPFAQGSYTLKNASIPIDIYDPPPVSGDYRASANITVGDSIIACYQISFSLTS